MDRLAAGRRPSIIMTRTPLRVSFAGGGTDLAAFYERGQGAVLSTAIDKYIWVTVKRHGEVFDERVRVTYSRTESVSSVQEVQNDIARECLRLLDIDPPIYISTVGDLPASTGLGGSSSFAVGLLNALHAFRGERVPAGQLAEEACQIEIDALRQPIGKQDQYAAAYGGLNLFSFRPGGWVSVEPQRISERLLNELFDQILLFWTGHQRDSSAVLGEQKANTGQRLGELEALREQAYELQALLRRGDVGAADVGRLLDRGWQLKRRLASTVSTSQIDSWYACAMEAGASGGKICGAGGGGFLLVIAERERHESVLAALGGLRAVRVQPESHGSQVMLPLMD
jgi:D-glycero-alpha-D-manno-heptose-7-phosphate kinase